MKDTLANWWIEHMPDWWFWWRAPRAWRFYRANIRRWDGILRVDRYGRVQDDTSPDL